MLASKRIMRGPLAVAALAAVGVFAVAPQAEAGGRHGGVSISVGFPVGDHGYVSVGSHRSWGHSSYRYSSHRYGYGYRGYYDRPVYVRPISRVCYDPWYPGYSSYRSRVIVYDTPRVYGYSSVDGRRDDARVYNVANDTGDYVSSASLVAQSSLPADNYTDNRVAENTSAVRTNDRTQRRSASTRPVVRQPAATVTLADAFAMLERGEDAEAQRAFAGLIARNPRDSHATVGYGLSSAVLGQPERAERAFAQANAANPRVWDALGRYPATRTVSVALLSDNRYADSPVMRAPLDTLSLATQPYDFSMPTGNAVAERD